MVAVGGVLCRVQRALQTLERKGKTRRGHFVIGFEHAREHRVIPTARTHGIGKTARIGLEHQTSVVIEGIHNGKVKGEQRGVLSIQTRDKRTKLARHVVCDTGCGEKLVHAIENRCTAHQARQLADGSLHGIGLAACHHASVQVHKIICVNHTQGVLGQRCVAHMCKKRFKRTDAATYNPGIGKAQSTNGACHQRNHLDIARGVPFADKLETQLRKLTGAASATHLLAHDRSLIAQAKRQIGRAHARRDQANDGKRIVGSHYEQAAIVIKQLERGVRNAATLLERALVLEQRRFDWKVMMSTKAVPHRLCDLLARLSLLGQNVPESPRCGRHTCVHPLYDSQHIEKRTGLGRCPIL